MKHHPTEINGCTVAEIATKTGKLRYDKLSDFLHELANEMARQAVNDREKGRNKLAHDAEELIQTLNEASECAHVLFEKYKKYLEHELK